jgi:nitronate monooxygenase
MLGASGVVMGTRFYAIRRRLGHRRQKTGFVLPLVTTGCAASCLDRWFGREVELLRHQEEEAAAATRFAAARRDNDFDIAAVIAGESSGLVRDNCSVRHARSWNGVVREASALLAQWSPQTVSG